jgi:hypothetical protein
MNHYGSMVIVQVYVSGGRLLTSRIAGSTGVAAQESPFPMPSDPPGSSPTFPAGRVATRVVIGQLGIDQQVMLQTPNYGTFPLCDVALYLPVLGQPGQGRANYI